MPGDYRDLLSIVDTWTARKVDVFKRQPYEDGGNAKSLREFVEYNNALSRRLISELQKQDEEFFASLAELANNCARIVAGGKVFVNKQDVTQEGM